MSPRGEPKLPWSFLETAFPFHFVVDRALRVVRAGQVLSRVSPVRVGAFLGDVISPKRPRLELAFEKIRAAMSLLVLLEVEGTGMLLRGQFVDLSDDGLMIFIGSPWLRDPEAVKTLGLTLGDFAVHEPVTDLLQEIQAQRVAAAEVRTLVGRLEAQRAELAAANAKLQQKQDDLERTVAELVEAKKRAEDATHAKGTFLSTMSHELRTPLNAIIGMTGLALGTQLTTEQRDFLSTVRTSGEALLALINDVLDFSKLESGMVELESLRFEVRSCIEDCLDIVAAQAARKELELCYELDPSVPTEVRGDVARLRQILLNLLANAVKFTTTGGVYVAVTLAPSDEGVRLRIAVRDTGIGIPEGRLARIFEPFAQADASIHRRYGGTGLGLAISSRIAHVLSGNLAVERTSPRGTTFVVEVPFERVPARAPATSTLLGIRVRLVGGSFEVRSAAGSQVAALGGFVVDERAEAELVLDLAVPARGSGPRVVVVPLGGSSASDTETDGIVVSGPLTLKKLRRALLALRKAASTGGSAPEVAPRTRAPASCPLRILLAEDNQANQQVLRAMLARFGASCDIVSDGAEAVALLQERDYDLVFMDLGMPNVDGLEATRRIRAVGRPVRIVALTASALAGERERCLAAGMDDYLSKPVRRDELGDALTAAMATPQRPWVDDARIDELGLPSDVFAEIVETFATGSKKRLDDLRAANLDGDAARAQRIAHELKGSCLTLGAARIGERFRLLEEESEFLSESHLSLLDDELARTIDALRLRSSSAR